MQSSLISCNSHDNHVMSTLTSEMKTIFFLHGNCFFTAHSRNISFICLSFKLKSGEQKIGRQNKKKKKFPSLKCTTFILWMEAKKNRLKWKDDKKKLNKWHRNIKLDFNVQIWANKCIDISIRNSYFFFFNCKISNKNHNRNGKTDNGKINCNKISMPRPNAVKKETIQIK